MKAKTREGRWGRKSGPDRDRQAEQEEEGATNEGSAGGGSRSASPGMEHPEQSGAQPRTRSSGGSVRVPRTGTSRAGPRNTKEVPWTGATGGRQSQEEAQTRT